MDTVNSYYRASDGDSENHGTLIDGQLIGGVPMPSIPLEYLQNRTVQDFGELYDGRYQLRPEFDGTYSGGNDNTREIVGGQAGAQDGGAIDSFPCNQFSEEARRGEEGCIQMPQSGSLQTQARPASLRMPSTTHRCKYSAACLP